MSQSGKIRLFFSILILLFLIILLIIRLVRKANRKREILEKKDHAKVKARVRDFVSKCRQNPIYASGLLTFPLVQLSYKRISNQIQLSDVFQTLPAEFVAEGMSVKYHSKIDENNYFFLATYNYLNPEFTSREFPEGLSELHDFFFIVQTDEDNSRVSVLTVRNEKLFHMRVFQLNFCNYLFTRINQAGSLNSNVAATPN